MEDYPHDVYAELLDEELPNHQVLRQKLQIYFHSKRRSGGGECFVEFEGIGKFIIRFKQEEVRNQVLLNTNHAITIDGKQIKVHLTTERKSKEPTPEPASGSQSSDTDTKEERAEDTYQPKAVVVENIPENMTRDLLGLIVERITGVTEEDYSMEMIYDLCVAVVMFLNPDNLKKFQAEAKLNKNFQQYNLTAQVLERTCSLKIEGLPPQVSKILLELYCEKHKVEVETLAMMSDENAAVVTFQKPEDVEVMLSIKHQISKVEVSTYPYYESLGTALYGKDRPRWKMPDPFTIGIHPAIQEFLLKKKLTSQINDLMEANNCQVSMNSSDVLISPLPTLLKMKGLTAKHIEGWRENTSEAFHRIMSKYKTLEKVMNSEVSALVAEELQSMVQDNVVMKMDPMTGQLTLAGMVKDIDNLRQIVDGIVQKATSQYERETNSISEEMDLSMDMYKLLELGGLPEYITASCPQVALKYNSSSKKLVLSGLNTEVLTLKTWILEKRMQMKQRPVELDHHIVEFLMAVDSEEMSDHLFFSCGIHAIYGISNRAVVLTATTEEILSQSIQKMKETLTFGILTVEDEEVLRKSEWKTLNTELLSMYNTSDKSTLSIKYPLDKDGKIVVAGYVEPVKEASLNLEEFLQNHTRTNDTVKVTCYAASRYIEEYKSEDWKKMAKVGEVVVQFDPVNPQINLSGERRYVKPAVDAFKRMATSLCIDEMKVCKPGAKKCFEEQGRMLLTAMLKDHRCRCLVLLQDNNMQNSSSQSQSDSEVKTLYRSPQTEMHPTELDASNALKRDGSRITLNEDRIQDASSESDCEEEMFYRSSQTPAEVFPTEPNASNILKRDGIRIILKEGNIQDASTDVVVNTVAENLNFSKGAVSKALLQAAGPQLQTAVYEVASGGVKCGEMVITDGFNLRCSKVFHTVCPPWDNGAGKSEEVLKKIIKDCLQEVDRRRLPSVTFPAIGTGYLSFPKDLVAKIMLEETELFCKKNRPKCLKEMVIIVHPSDQESVKCFSRAFQGEREQKSRNSGSQKQPSSGLWGQVNTVSLGNTFNVRIGHLTLEVSAGDITKETTDVVVNSSNGSFSLKSGVSKAILEAAGSAVELECSNLVKSANFQPCNMILTSAGRLPCKYIVHLVGDSNPKNITDRVHEVLTFCEKRTFTSISFPAIGTGQSGANAAAVADAMIEATVSFVKKTKSQNVQFVKIIIFQTQMVSVFHQRLLAQQAKAGEDDKGILKRMKDALVGWFSTGLPEEQGRVEKEFIMKTEEFAPAIFQLCGETSQDVSRAKELVTSSIIKELTSAEIRDPLINSFTQEEAKELQDLQRELNVSIKLEKRYTEPVICLEGLARDVFKVEGRIRDMIRKADRQQTTKREALMISALIQWQYVDPSNKLVPFDLFTNMTLEQAFQTKVKRVKIKIGRDEYDADLLGRVAIRHGRKVELKRVDRKGLDDSVSLPDYWDDKKDKTAVQIPAGTKEYQDVEREFRRTGLASPITKIERVQNSALWKSYIIKKQEFEKKNNHTNNEKRLWHGTSVNTLDHINHHGFNRSFGVCAWYGDGCYFAVDPQYSVNSRYAKPDVQGVKCMYLARVLVGDYTQGQKGMKTPPAKNSGNSADLYDSVTDNMANPKEFVIFHDSQAYPEYIITFQ